MPLGLPETTDPEFLEAYLEYTEAGTRKTIVFDAVLSEAWTHPATVTEHPVETGANVADHVRVGLATCTLTVRVSNEPLGANQFTDPVSANPPYSSLGVQVRRPYQDPHDAKGHEFSGLVLVPTWNSNLVLSEQIGIIANIASSAIGGLAQEVADATPLGNAFAAGLKPVIRASQTANEVLAYDVPQVAIGGSPVRNVGDAVGSLVFEGVTSLIPPGEEVDLPVLTTVGLPISIGGADSVTVHTVQFGGSVIDFAAEMVGLLIKLKDAAQQFTVQGSKANLPSAVMVIETLSTRRGAPEDTGTGVEITLGFKEVRLVSTNTVEAALPKIPALAAVVDKGAQDSTPTPDPVTSVPYMLGQLVGIYQ